MPRLRVSYEPRVKCGPGIVALQLSCLIVTVLCLLQTAAVFFVEEESISRPVGASLEIARLGVSGVVEDGFDAETLDTAIGLLPQGARPGEPGNMILAGHRDTYFAGLKDAQAGDLIVIHVAGGRRYDYRVVRTLVVTATDSGALRSTPGQRMLTLITCHPFRSMGEAPARLVVQAEPEDIHHFSDTVI
jgi:LPXTG-site transpeptidase (sortase) family protein